MRSVKANNFRDARILREATDQNGRYDAGKIAKLLDWNLADVAAYLGRDPSTISRFGTSGVHQDKLGALASLAQEVFVLLGHDLRATRTWFRTPLRALENVSPRHAILHADFAKVSNLVQESRSGLAL